ncbi:MAG: hypothetical protein IPJ74_25045 [Saprospiraceae bacterium]|nr:hypothetical protein [Saprospiraceae bacterium]
MASIRKTSSAIDNLSTETQMTTFVTNYWGSNNEKMFPIAFWKLKRLFAASTTDEAALRITDIFSPNEIDGRWLVFDGNYEEVLEDPNVQGNDYYFVLNESDFDEIRANIATPNEHIIWGRIGKDNNGNFFAFFNAAKCTLLGTGTGNDGTLNGFKIPSP